MATAINIRGAKVAVIIPVRNIGVRKSMPATVNRAASSTDPGTTVNVIKHISLNDSAVSIRR